MAPMLARLPLSAREERKVLDILCGYPLDYLYFGDDWGQQRGTIMGPANWRRFIKPRVKALYDRAKRGGFFL